MNKREAIQAILDGKKVRRKDWSNKNYFCLLIVDGFNDSNRNNFYINSEKNDNWELYEEPKPKKKLTFTRPKWAKFYERLNTSPEWMSTKEAWLNLHSNPITSDEWETIEVEVDE